MTKFVTIKDFPKIPTFYSGTEKQMRDRQWKDLVKCYEWKVAFEKQLKENLDRKFRDWLSDNRWINSEQSIGPWKRQAIKIGLLKIVNEELLGDEADKPKSKRAKNWHANLSELPQDLKDEVVAEIDRQEAEKP